MMSAALVYSLKGLGERAEAFGCRRPRRHWTAFLFPQLRGGGWIECLGSQGCPAQTGGEGELKSIQFGFVRRSPLSCAVAAAQRASPCLLSISSYHLLLADGSSDGNLTFQAIKSDGNQLAPPRHAAMRASKETRRVTLPAHTIEEEVASTSMDASIRANAVHHCGPPSNLPHLLLRQRALPPKEDLARVSQLNHSQPAGHTELG